jgi:hypothetical protein
LAGRPAAALAAPEDIRLEQVPVKREFDFTRRSANMQLIKEGRFDAEFTFRERSDSKIGENDLERLQVEL